MPETQVQSLGQEDPLEKEMATHSSILAWEVPWTEEPGRLQSVGSQRVGHDLVTKPQPQCTFIYFHIVLGYHLAVWLGIFSFFLKVKIPKSQK